MDLFGISEFFSKVEPIVNVLGATIGMLGGVIGGISAVFCKKAKDRANDAAKKIEEYEIKIKEIEIENAQFAKVINNYGLTYQDTKEVAREVFDDKAKNKPDIFIQTEPPENAGYGTIWMEIE